LQMFPKQPIFTFSFLFAPGHYYAPAKILIFYID